MDAWSAVWKGWINWSGIVRKGKMAEIWGEVAKIKGHLEIAQISNTVESLLNAHICIYSHIFMNTHIKYTY